MSVGLLAVRLLYRFYVCVHLSEWFTFFSFKFVSVFCVVVFLRLLVTHLFVQVYSPKLTISCCICVGLWVEIWGPWDTKPLN